MGIFMIGEWKLIYLMRSMAAVKLKAIMSVGRILYGFGWYGR